VTGIIYLDSSATNFNEAHLQLVSAIASFAAGALANARRIAWLESENKRLLADAHLDHSMIGESAKMRQVYHSIAKVAPTSSTVLILGESGTGKELVARAIHNNSPRAHHPFVAINCAAVTETLLESELFGYEKGAFTGAATQTRGKLETANGGTVFLDEVGEMSLPLQAKLLRVLQEREFERVGGTRQIKVDLRVIAATNKDLERAVAEGSFRKDLYYRLNIISMVMPPLRERREDIHLLAQYFVPKYSERCKRGVDGISPEAQRYLIQYDWPGNVRELENAIERAVVLGSADVIMPEDLPGRVLEAGAPASQGNYYKAVKEAKRQLILTALEQTNGNITEAAKALGVHPNNLHRLIRNLDLRTGLSR
jgi:Nif-specific regulatory protein